jgi:hypothetical protein
MELKAEVTRRSYSVEIPMDAMLRLLESERTGKLPLGVMLSEKMEEYEGVSDVDYNGHFGAAVFYTVDDEDDTPDLHQTLFDHIRTACK